MSEIIDSPVTKEAEATEIDLIRRLAESEGYNPDEVLPLPEETTPEVVEEVPVEEPKAAPTPTVDVVDPDYLFKLRQAKRMTAAHDAAHPKTPHQPPAPPPAPDPTSPPPQAAPAEQENILRDLGDPPSVEEDPKGLVEWLVNKQKQLEVVSRAIVADRQQQQRAYEQQQQLNQVHEEQTAWVKDVAQAEKEWMAANPEYGDRYNQVKEGLSDVYLEQGISKEKVEALVKSEMHGMARLAFDEGVHPCRMVESLHRKLFPGTSPPAPKPRNSSGQFTAAREAKAAGEGVDLSASTSDQPGLLNASMIRESGATQRQIKEVLTKNGTKGMLNMMRQAELGQ